MSKFIQVRTGIFQSRENQLWDSGGRITGDIATWICEGEAFQGVKDGGNVLGEFENWTAEIFAQGNIEGDTAAWTGGLFGPGTIEADFQLWNGTIWGDLGMIVGSFAPFSADYPAGIQGQFSFNHLAASFVPWSGEVDCGGNIYASLQSVSGSATGSVGTVLGVSAWFLAFSGEMYAGGNMLPEIQAWTAEITGTVTHVDRITADMALWDCEIHGDATRGADIAADMRMMSGGMLGRVETPGRILGEVGMFNGFMAGIAGDVGSIEGDFYLWGAQDRIYAHTGGDSDIVGHFAILGGSMKGPVVSDCDDLLVHRRGKIR